MQKPKQVAVFALIKDYKTDERKTGVLVTNEHGGKYGSLLPGGRLNDSELFLFNHESKLGLNYKLEVLFRALEREVSEELNQFFMPNMEFIKAYPQEFKNEPGEAWYVGGSLYKFKQYNSSIASDVVSIKPNLDEVVKNANPEVLPVTVLDRDRLKGKILIDSMAIAANEFLSTEEFQNIFGINFWNF